MKQLSKTCIKSYRDCLKKLICFSFIFSIRNMLLKSQENKASFMWVNSYPSAKRGAEGWLPHPKKGNYPPWAEEVVWGCIAKKWHIPVDSNHPLQILAFHGTKIKPKNIEKRSLPPAAQWHNRKCSNRVPHFSMQALSTLTGMDVCIMCIYALVLTSFFSFERKC